MAAFGSGRVAHVVAVAAFAAAAMIASAAFAGYSIPFAGASFTVEHWINGKQVFKKPRLAEVEFSVMGEFDWVFADDKGKEVRTLREKNPGGGWHTVDLPSLGLHGDYSIGFRNVGSAEKRFKHGSVKD